MREHADDQSVLDLQYTGRCGGECSRECGELCLSLSDVGRVTGGHLGLFTPSPSGRGNTIACVSAGHPRMNAIVGSIAKSGRSLSETPGKDLSSLAEVTIVWPSQSALMPLAPADLERVLQSDGMCHS